MARVFLKDADAGQWIEDVFVLSQKQLSTTQTGKPFIKCVVGDSTRQIPARMWNASQSIFNAMPDGGFLRLAGKLESYQDNLQLIIERFWIIDDPAEIKLDELLPHTRRDIDTMFARVREILGTIRSRSLLDLMDAYLADEKLMAEFRRAPAAMSFHHAYIGGLLEHTLGVMELGCAIGPLYPALNRDLLVAGLFIHDLAKTWELTYTAGFGYSDGGQLVGHIVKGAIWLEQKAADAQTRTGRAIPADLLAAIQHIVLSHHGQPEFGAAKVPASPEAIIAHLIDNIDAKATLALQATRDPLNTGESTFTEFNKALGTRLYRPDVAPADVDVTASQA
jgi:3'-5' exoribonuclease